jgi:hypothetical protein
MIDPAAITTVHTTGINWDSVLTIAGSVAGSVGGAARYIVSRVERSRLKAQVANEKFVRGLVADVTRVVDLKLGEVGKHLAEQDRQQTRTQAQLADVRERSARIEGRLAASSRGA